MIHLALSDKDPRLPSCEEVKACDRTDCAGKDGFEQAFGLAGGGYGAYLICNVCDKIVAKTCYDE